MTAIDRIIEMERLLDDAEASLTRLDQALNEFKITREDVDALTKYYNSDWKSDLEADDRGLLPKNLKRGVLSQDGIFDLLTHYRETCDRLIFEAEKLRAGEK